MPARYAPIPSRSDPDTNPELDAAFDDSDDDDDASESHPLHPHSPSPRSSLDHTNTTLTYNFNTPVAEWDQPPPGSPPPATPFALPNSIGNSNGVIPTFSSDITPRTHSTWWGRATAFLPRLGNPTQPPRTRTMGGGTGNDGVFSNVSAKPTTSGTRVQEGLSFSLPFSKIYYLFLIQETASISSRKIPLQQHHPLMPLHKLMQRLRTILHSCFSLLPPSMIPMPFLVHQCQAQSSSTPCLQAPCLRSSGILLSAPPSNLLVLY